MQFEPRLTKTALRRLLRSFRDLEIAVVGDFFLDAYFDCDPGLAERSLETGKNCHQVVRTRRQAGAAGTVASNLAALGVGRVEAVGFSGDDGEGYELRREMANLGLGMDGFFAASNRFTPTYGKPCYIDLSSGVVTEELERLDIENRRPTPAALQEKIIAYVRRQAPRWDGVIIVDQANEANCGVITTRVRRCLSRLARERTATVFLADSRERIACFRHVIVKPNQREAATALGDRSHSLSAARQHAVELSRRTRRPTFLTLSKRGMLVADAGGVSHIPGYPAAGATDPVGAGDSTSAALVAALCAGAPLEVAADVANLVGSITVQQIGTTGTASPSQIIRRFEEVGALAA